VATPTLHDLKHEWLEIALNKAGIDWAKWIPEKGVSANRSAIEAVYNYYGSLFLGQPRLEWAGMAKLIGASFYGGFLDIASAPGRLLRFYETTFLRMQKKIFEDQAVMHEAYLAGGLAEITALRKAEIIDSATVNAWGAIDSAANRPDWHQGNRWLLYREQDDIIDHFYVSMAQRHDPQGSVLTYVLTLCGMPSIPGARAYPMVFPLTINVGPTGLRTPLAEGNIAVFPNRWALIDQDTLPAYIRLLADGDRASALIRLPIAERAAAFRLLNRAHAITTMLVTRWRTTGAHRSSVAREREATVSAPDQRTVLLDLRRESPHADDRADVRSWANARHRPFPVEVLLPGGRRYRDEAQLVKLYKPERSTDPARVTVKLPATELDAAQRKLQELAQDLSLDANAVAAWRATAGRPAELGHNYSSRVFTGERIESVEVEIQVEHHVAEGEIVIDVLFAAHPPTNSRRP
jgi:hypothetical protein